MKYANKLLIYLKNLRNFKINGLIVVSLQKK